MVVLMLYLIVLVQTTSAATPVVAVMTNPGNDCSKVADIPRVTIFEGCTESDGTSESFSCEADGGSITAASFSDGECSVETASVSLTTPTTCEPIDGQVVNDQKYCGLPTFLKNSDASYPFLLQLYSDAKCSERVLVHIFNGQCVVDEEDDGFSFDFVWQSSKIVRRAYETGNCTGDSETNQFTSGDCTQIGDASYVIAGYSADQTIAGAVEQVSSGSQMTKCVVQLLLIVTVALWM